MSMVGTSFLAEQRGMDAIEAVINQLAKTQDNTAFLATLHTSIS